MNRLVFIAMRWLTVAFYCVMILVVPAGAVVPPEALQIFGMDKLIHLIVYAILCFLICRALVATVGRMLNWRLLVLAIVLTVLYGVFDEIQQMYMPNRCASPFDVIADALGAVCAALIWPWATAKWRILMR